MSAELVVKEVLELKDCIVELELMNIESSAFVHVPTEVYNRLEICGEFTNDGAHPNPSLRYKNKVVIFNSSSPYVNPDAKEIREDEG